MRRDAPGALADLERAIALRPGEPSLLRERAHAEHAARRWEAAGRDLLAALRVQPTEGRELLDPVVSGLVYDGWSEYQAGRRDDALRLFELAVDLAPDRHDVLQRRTRIVMGAYGKPRDGVAQLTAAARDAPDSFRAHQQLDYALARDGKFDQVVAMWNEYLARHPGDGPAHLERGGAYLHLGRMKEAHDDAAQACALGVGEGRARAEQLAGRRPR